jgi:CheY-like chemotaxis protein
VDYPRVLLVGAEEAELAHTLRGRFFEVDVVEPGAVAAALRAHRYDAVVLGSVSDAERTETGRLVGEAGLQPPLDGAEAERVLEGVSSRVRASLVPRKRSRDDTPRNRGAKPTILLVDDDLDMRTALKRLLRRVPASVLQADSVSGALEMVEVMDVQMVIADYRLAGRRHGLQLLAELKRTKPSIRRVLMTGYSLSAPELAGDRSVAETMIQKPWNVGDLLSMCRDLLENRA